MRKTIGLTLTTLAFMIGVIAGGVDSATTHVAVAPAHAERKGGGGGTGGCDGHGAAASCNTCSGGQCILVCTGADHCTISGTQCSSPSGDYTCTSGGSGPIVRYPG